MPYHVWIGKVNDDHIILPGLNCPGKFIAYLVRAHLRFQIIGGNLRRIHKNPVLIRLLNAAVEEERHMCIFFRLCDTSLPKAALC